MSVMTVSTTKGVVAAGEPGRADPITLTMPMPPSVNQAYRNLPKGGRALTKVARDWEGHALWHVKAQRLPIITGPVVLIFSFERASLRADASNRFKLTEDILVKAGVIEDDRFVTGAAFSWVPRANGLCHILVAPCRAMSLRFDPSQDGACGGFSMTAPQAIKEH